MLKALLLAAFAACTASRPVIATWGACPPDIKGDGTVDGLKDAMLHGLNTWFVGPVQVFRPELMGLTNKTQLPHLLDVYSTIGGNGANELGPTSDPDGYEIFTDTEIENTTQKLVKDLTEYGLKLKGYDFDIEPDCESQGSTPFNNNNLANLKKLMTDARLHGTKHWFSLEASNPLDPRKQCLNASMMGSNVFQTIHDLYNDGKGPLAGINIMMFDNDPLHHDFFVNPRGASEFLKYYQTWLNHIPDGMPVNIGYPVQFSNVTQATKDFTAIKKAFAASVIPKSDPAAYRSTLDGLTLFPGLGNIKSFDQNVTRFLKIWHDIPFPPHQVSQIQCKSATGAPAGYCPDTDKCCDGPSGTGQSCYNPDIQDCCTTGPGAGHVCPKNKCSTRTGFICN